MRNNKKNNTLYNEVDFNHPLSLEQQQKIMCEMLYAFDDFCKINNINYFLIGGTLLGAIRHKGFIPWDDDVDVVVPRNDYEKLKKCSCINNHTDIVSFDSKDYYHPFSHINLVDKRTLRISDSTRIQSGQGLFVDIFPLDVVPSKRRDREKFINDVRKIDRIISYSIKKMPPKNGLKNVIKCIIFIPLRLFDPIKYAQIEDNISKKYADKDYDMVGITKFKTLHWPKSCFRKYILWQFENKLLHIPIDYDKVLTMHYGEYMVPPPEDERICKHPAKVYWRKRENNTIITQNQ